MTTASFFLQKRLKADIEGDFQRAAVAWALKDQTIGSTTAWPRVAYIGEPKDLAQQTMQKNFHYFRWLEGLSSFPNSGDWYGQMYHVEFEIPLPEIQICIGWKINWETLRTVYLDNILLQAG